MANKMHDKLERMNVQVTRASFHPFKCHQCSRYFHDFCFFTWHKKKHEQQYKIFWLRKRQQSHKKSRVDQLCEKMMVHQQSALMHKLHKWRLLDDYSTKITKTMIPDKIKSDLLFSREGNAIQHTTTNTRKKSALIQKVKEYPCMRFCRVFQHKSCLWIHDVPHSTDQSLRCCTCDSSFKHIQNWRRHNVEHSSGGTCITCRICDKTFHRHSSYKVHLKVHLGIKPFVYLRCRKRFSWGKYLKVHKRLHSKGYLFRCHWCPKKFISKLHLLSHQRMHAEEKTSVCIFCGKVFHQVKKPMHKRTPTDEYKFECRCKEFSKHDAFKVHENTLVEEKHKCQHCTAAFNWNPAHDQIHSSIRDHRCEICCKKILLGSSLKQQLILHADDRQFTSQDCNNDYAYPSTQKTHVKTRNRKQLYASGVCGKACSNRSQVRRYEVKDLSRRPIECQICCTRFSTKKLVENCESKHHPPADSCSKDTGKKTVVKDKQSIGTNVVELKRVGDAQQRSANLDLLGQICENTMSSGSSTDKTTTAKEDLNEEMIDDGVTNDDDTNKVDNNNCENWGIPNQPLVRNLGMSKVHSAPRREKAPKRSHSSLHSSQAYSVKCLSPTEDNTTVASQGNLSPLKIEPQYDHSIEGVSVTQSVDKDTEDNNQNLTDRDIIKVDMAYRDPSDELVIEQAPVQSSMSKSNIVPEHKESKILQVPSLLGIAGCAIEEELLKFYGHVIGHIGLTVYKEHENELYGRNLSQIGLYNAGHLPDTLSKD